MASIYCFIQKIVLLVIWLRKLDPSWYVIRTVPDCTWLVLCDRLSILPSCFLPARQKIQRKLKFLFPYWVFDEEWYPFFSELWTLMGIKWSLLWLWQWWISIELIQMDTQLQRHWAASLGLRTRWMCCMENLSLELWQDSEAGYHCLGDTCLPVRSALL